MEKMVFGINKKCPRCEHKIGSIEISWLRTKTKAACRCKNCRLSYAFEVSKANASYDELMNDVNETFRNDRKGFKSGKIKIADGWRPNNG